MRTQFPHRPAALLAAVLALLALAACAPALAGARELTSARAAAGGWWQLPHELTWYWQLQGKIKMSEPVEAYDVDGFETSSTQVAELKARGVHVICYIDAGTAENWRPDYDKFPASVLGRSNGWPGERWIDVRQLSVIEPIMAARFQMCQEKGFEAVEPDNIEAYANNSGFPITAQDQLTYNEWIAEEVHSLGLAVLQKNDPQQSQQLVSDFDGALSEQCNQYHECAEFEPYLQAGKPVLNAEYHLKPAKFCSADEAAGITGARFNLQLNGRRFEPCWGSAGAKGSSPRSSSRPRARAAGDALAYSHASSGAVQPQPSAGSCHARGRGLYALPDPLCTPGALNPAVDQADIASTICARGWSSSVRPPESVTEPEKLASMRAYGIAGDASEFEYDHLVPLELGGAPNDPRNLWPELNYPAAGGYFLNPKDHLEDALNRLVCDGQMQLARAQQLIARDWLGAYRTYG
jgi:hypothetical protein